MSSAFQTVGNTLCSGTFPGSPVVKAHAEVVEPACIGGSNPPQGASRSALIIFVSIVD